MVIFGPTPTVAAHQQRGAGGNPLAPKRDRSFSLPHRGPPPVPRAPRPPQKPQSAGALARDVWSRRPGSSRSSSRRSSREAPPPQQPEEGGGRAFGRVAALAREVDAPENQRFEMGPERRAASVGCADFRRGHVLGQERVANVGMPWMAVKFAATGASDYSGADDGQERGAGRRHTLRHERLAAEQALEWVPSAAALDTAAAAGDRDYSRVHALARENAEPFEFLPGARRNSHPIGTEAGFGRRNMLKREGSATQSLEVPQPSSYDGAVPNFRRDNRLTRERPLGFAGAALVAAN